MPIKSQKKKGNFHFLFENGRNISWFFKLNVVCCQGRGFTHCSHTSLRCSWASAIVSHTWSARTINTLQKGCSLEKKRGKERAIP